MRELLGSRVQRPESRVQQRTYLLRHGAVCILADSRSQPVDVAPLLPRIRRRSVVLHLSGIHRVHGRQRRTRTPPPWPNDKAPPLPLKRAVAERDQRLAAGESILLLLCACLQLAVTAAARRR